MRKYFNKGGEGNNSLFQVEAFLAYWLSYFVFLSSPKDGINSYVFPLVVLLTKGNRLVLAPLYLGSLYAWLDECSKGVFKSMGRYDVVTYVDASFLQLFLWKRFGALSTVLVEFKPGKPKKVMVDVVEKKKTSHFKPRGFRWSGVTWPEEVKKPLSKVIDVEKSYKFWVYAYMPRGVTLNFILCLVE